MQEWTFADEIRLVNINVVRAAIYFAREIVYPDLDTSHYLGKLNQLTTAAHKRLGDEPSRLRQGTLLAELLFGVDGLRGNLDDYSDPRNSYLNDVLDRRLGIPISLSVIYVEIAQRLHIPAFGVGMPGHYIVGVREGSQTWYLDPFYGGGRLSINDCARLVRSATGYTGSFQPRWLEPDLPRNTLARMLSNLRVSYVQRKIWSKAALVIERLRLLQPDVPEHVRDLGLVYYRSHKPRLAAHYLELYLQAAPDASDAKAIREGIAATLDEWTRLN